MERRERAEGVHQGQHPPPLPTVVLGRDPDPHSQSHQQIFDLFSPPKKLFQVSEWAVDASVPGGTDKEGWQYAADFPAYVTTAAATAAAAQHHQRCNVGPCFLQQDFPRTQNLEGLREASKMDEVPGHAPP